MSDIVLYKLIDYPFHITGQLQHYGENLLVKLGHWTLYSYEKQSMTSTHTHTHKNNNYLLHDSRLSTLSNDEEDQSMKKLTGSNLQEKKNKARSKRCALNYASKHLGYQFTFVCLSLEEVASSQIRGRKGSRMQ